MTNSFIHLRIHLNKYLFSRNYSKFTRFPKLYIHNTYRKTVVQSNKFNLNTAKSPNAHNMWKLISNLPHFKLECNSFFQSKSSFIAPWLAWNIVFPFFQLAQVIWGIASLIDCQLMKELHELETIIYVVVTCNLVSLGKCFEYKSWNNFLYFNLFFPKSNWKSKFEFIIYILST